MSVAKGVVLRPALPFRVNAPVMVASREALKENDLPLDIDVWTEVLEQLDAPDISRLSRSSKRAAALVSRFP